MVIFGKKIDSKTASGTYLGLVLLLGDSELLDSEQTGNSEPFPMTNLPLYFMNI